MDIQTWLTYYIFCKNFTVITMSRFINSTSSRDDQDQFQGLPWVVILKRFFKGL
jgi:hypothetical protein